MTGIYYLNSHFPDRKQVFPFPCHIWGIFLSIPLMGWWKVHFTRETDVKCQSKPCSPYLLSLGTASLKSGMTPLWKSSNSLSLLSAYLDWHTRLPRTLKGTLETVYSLINGPGERGAGEGKALSATTSNVKVLKACRTHLDIFVTAILIINYTITYTLKTNLVPGRLKGTEQIQSNMRSFST